MLESDASQLFLVFRDVRERLIDLSLLILDILVRLTLP